MMPMPSHNDKEDEEGSAKDFGAKESGNRRVIQGQAIDYHKKHGGSGADRGVFIAGLCACAVGARSGSEALPFARRLHEETGEGGAVMAHYAMASDSPAFLEAIVELGLLSLQNDLVWSGFGKKNGELAFDRDVMGEAIHRGSVGCVKYLWGKVPSAGLLALAATERHEQVFDALLSYAVSSGDHESLHGALAKVCDASRLGWDSDKLSGQELLGKLLAAGAKLDIQATGPEEWHSWNGARVGEIDCAFAPSLRLCEDSDDIPAGASREGFLPGKDLFANWSPAALLARSAVEAGDGEPAARMLDEAPGWAQARAPRALLTPLAVMAMAHPTTTDSGLRRTLLPTAELVARQAEEHPECLMDMGPFALCKVAVARWLWGSAPIWSEKVGQGQKLHLFGIKPDPLVGALSALCQERGLKPLGEQGALAAGQEFVARLWVFSGAAHQSLYGSHAIHDSVEQRFARQSREADVEARSVSASREAADQLAMLMPDHMGSKLRLAVESCHAKGKIANAHERAAFMESVVLGLSQEAPRAARRVSL
jgi:hypothetical protein